MENKNNISKLTKILFVALAMGMILISPYQLCNVAAADKYYGYQKKTKSVKTKITASKILLRQSEILKRQLQKIKSILFAIRRKLVLMAEFQVMYRNN